MKRLSLDRSLLLWGGVALLALGLLWPGSRGQVEHQESLRARIEYLQFGESRFRELVISLRHGLANNYDEANTWMARILEARAGVARDVGAMAELAPAWVAYEQAVRHQSPVWEDFKSRNAVVRNSLRYFQNDALNFLRHLPREGQAGTLSLELMVLSNALNLQALGEGREAGETVTRVLETQQDVLARIPAPLQPEYERLVRHARIIGTHSQDLAMDVDALVHSPGRQALAELARQNHVLLINAQAQAGRYRVGLVVAVLALALALVWVLNRYLVNLRQSARTHRLAGVVFSSSQQGIIVTDVSGAIVQVNPAYCEITGYTAEELVGQNPRILRSGLQGPDFYRSMWRSLEETGRWQGELKNRRKSGDLYVQWINIDAVVSPEGERLYVGIVTDISELVHTREKLASLAYYDTLTGLPNRVLFQDRLRQAMVHAKREHQAMALVFCDLDNFKVVNDSLGHAAGDELLQVLASRLRQAVRESDTVARLGGDEFAIILADARGPEEIARMAGHLIHLLSRPCQIQGAEITSGASLGITFYPNDAQSEEELLKNADVAMYRAKERGRNDFQFFTGEMASVVAETLRIENGLRLAIDSRQLFLHYQPQVRSDGRIVGMEALMRWESPDLGQVSPARFIPVAEKSGLIGALGEFALREACRQCALWRARLDPELRMAVNLSAAQFRHEGLAAQVEAMLHAFNLPGSALELEITESVVMEDVARGQEVLRRLKSLGCRLAIDDFGTGYSSLAYLKRFQVDVLKLDKSFVDGLGTDAADSAEDTAVAQAVVSLASSLRLEVVAEGVETAEQLACLTQLAGKEGFISQGYYYAPPVAPDQFEATYRRLAAGGTPG
jgi:diguanylate cyclase (GGDEF)-like protein/PAS domain S-box-containing protein